MTLTFTVYGEAIPQGSLRAFERPGHRPIVTSDNPRLHKWRRQVAWEAHAAVQHLPAGERRVTGEAVIVTVTFYLPRPKSLPRRVWAHVTRPDCDKLIRGVHDALTGVVYRDDSQVVEIHARKCYALDARPRVEVRVESSHADAAPLFREMPA